MWVQMRNDFLGDIHEKIFCCKDLGIICDWEGLAETEEELLEIVTRHASEEHGMKEMTEPMRRKIIGKMQDTD